jgi:hypothetical protein
MPSWKSLAGVPSFTPDTMLLMTDATVLVHDSYGSDWYRLKPDGNGKYETPGASINHRRGRFNRRPHTPPAHRRRPEVHLVTTVIAKAGALRRVRSA